MTRIALIFSLLICKLSFSQTNLQTLFINDNDFCGFSDYYISIDGYDKTLIFRMTVDSLTRNHDIRKIIVKPKGVSYSNYQAESYDSIGNKICENENFKKINCLRKEYDESGRIIEIEKESFTTWTRIERYKYDIEGRLIEINNELKPLPRDTDDATFGHLLICISLPNRWLGEYDNAGNLIKSEIHFDNGDIYKEEYQYLSGKLVSMKYESSKGKKSSRVYIYKAGLLKSIVYFNKKNRKVKRENYEWKIIKKGNL